MARRNDPLLLDEFRDRTDQDGRGLFRFNPTERGLEVRGFRGGQTLALSVDTASYTSEAVVSTSELDRYDSIIVPDGWQLEDYRKNPVVFWGHEDWKLPIGKSTDQRVLSNGLQAKTQFAVNESPQRVGEIFALHSNGYLNAWSVGWIPLEWEEFQLEKDGGTLRGVRFTKNELLEYSLVGVPGNPNALTLARGFLAAARRCGKTIPGTELSGDLGLLSRACQLAATCPDLPAEAMAGASDVHIERMIRALDGASTETRLAPWSECRASAALESAFADMRQTGEAILVAR